MEGITKSLVAADEKLRRLNTEIEKLRPLEANVRKAFEEAWTNRSALVETLRLFDERDSLLTLKADVQKAAKGLIQNNWNERKESKTG